MKTSSVIVVGTYEQPDNDQVFVSIPAVRILILSGGLLLRYGALDSGEKMPETDFSAVISEIRDKTDIAGLIAEYLPLKKRGRNFWGCCPFHNEKTPSFSVNAEKGMFYCFGCHEGGDAFAFVMKIENRPFIEAARILAERAGITIPERTRHDTAADRMREAVRSANKMAMEFFHSCLVNTGYGTEPLQYLQQRGVSPETVGKFGIGYAPGAPDKLCHALRKRGVPDDVILKAGLAVKTQRGTLVDAFRNRVMVPIVDLRGSVIAFGGRAFGDFQPKYLNTPDTELFSKRTCLFALNIAQAAARKENALILVEGYFDAISLHAGGIDYAVAGMGTALSERQAALASKNASTVYLCFDNDTAGHNATLRAYEVFKATGAKLRVINLQDSKDPDECIRQYGAGRFEELRQAAAPILDFVIDYHVSAVGDGSLDDRVAALEKILLFFTGYLQPLELEERFKVVAGKLRLDERLIREEFSKTRGATKRSRNIEGKIRDIVAENDMNETERQLISIFIEKSALRFRISEKMPGFEFSSPKIKEFWQSLYNIYTANEMFTTDYLIQQTTEAGGDLRLLSRLLMKSVTVPDDEVIEVAERLLELNTEQNLRRKLQMHIKTAGELEKSGSPDYILELRKANEISAQLQAMRKINPREGN